MQADICSQTCIITPTLLHKFQSKKLLSSLCTTNRLILLTQSHFIIVNPNQPKYKCQFPIDSQNIIRWSVNNNNQICILHSNGLMQIRSIQYISEIKYRFGNIQVKIGRGFPQLYWQDQDIYVLGQNILQVVNIKKKERKMYSQLVTLSQGKNLLGLVESKLLDRQRIIIMIFNDKITFNIVPIPITEMIFQDITRFYLLNSPFAKYLTSQQKLPREYLVLILNNKILRVYNVINMKPVIQIQYQNTGYQFISLTSDRNKQFLLVTFITKKNKVTRNILYKINTQEYYQGKDYFQTHQNFFLFQIQLEIKENLLLFPPRQIQLDGNCFITIDVGHIRHYIKRSKGEIFVTTFIINPFNARKKGISNCKTKVVEWKELREWKDIITSYIEMKNTLDQIDFDIDQQQQQEYLTRPKIIRQTNQSQYSNKNIKARQTIPPKNTTTNIYPTTIPNKNITNPINPPQNPNLTSNNKPNTNIKNSSVLKPVKQNKQMYNLQTFNEVNNKLIKQYQQGTRVIEQRQKQMQSQIQIQKCQKLKVSLLDGARKFKAQAINFSSHQDHQKKFEEQFYKFMAEYLREQQQDIDTQALFRKNSQQNIKVQFKEQQKYKDSCEQYQHYNKSIQNIQAKNKNKQKQQKGLLTSKSSQQLAKNPNGSSYLNRTKSSANEQFQANISNLKHKNQSIVSSFSQKNRQIITKSQENIQVHSQTNSQDSQLDIMALKITQAITKAFNPLQKKIDNLQQHIKRIQSIHINQLKSCQRASNRQVSQLNNIDMTIKGYCQQLMFQFQNNLQNGLKSYWTKIQDVDKKASKQRNKAVDSFGLFIDQQIKSREVIFDQSRSCIQNSLSHLRRKMGSFFTFIDQQEDEDELYQKFKRYKNADYGFGLDIQNENEDDWKDEQP